MAIWTALLVWMQKRTDRKREHEGVYVNRGEEKEPVSTANELGDDKHADLKA